MLHSVALQAGLGKLLGRWPEFKNVRRCRLFHVRDWITVHFRPFLLLALVCLPWSAVLCYQHFWIRDRIPARYQSRLTDLLTQYSSQSSTERFQTAEEIEVCFNRLAAVGLRQSSGLDELKFYSSHLSWLREFFKDEQPAGSTVSDQVAKYENIVSELMANLVRSSDFEVKRFAYLALAERYLEGTTNQNANEVIATLDTFLGQSQQPDDSLRGVLAEMLLEEAWRSQYGNLVILPDKSLLERSRKIAEPLPVGSSKREQLLVRLDTFLNPKSVLSSNEMLLETAESRIITTIIKGSWDEVSWEVTNCPEHHKDRLSKWAGQEISRTLLSDFSTLDGAWCARATQGLQLAARLNLDSPEFPSVIWQLAMRHAEVDGTGVSSALLETVLTGDRGELKFPILAYSNLLKGEPENAKKYLDLALQINPMVADFVAMQCIWYVQRDREFLSQWSDLIHYLRSKSEKSGGAHLAACLVAIEQQDWKEAKSALSKAQEILGEVSAVFVLSKRLEQAPGD